MLTEECAHHEPVKCQHLPAEFFDAYRHYKIGTRAVVAWLIQHGACNCPQSSAVSVRDLKRFAGAIRSKSIAMPESILFQLRETIHARKRLSKFFRKCYDPGCTQDENEAHEFFTATLQEILQDFSHRCTLTQTAKPFNPVATQLNEEDTFVNRFEALSLLSTKDSTLAPSEDVPFHGPPLNTKVKKPRPQEDQPPNVTEDMIGDAASILQLAQEMQELSETACDVWAEAAKGDIPTVAAALITNVAFTMFEDIESRFCHVIGSSDPDLVQEAFLKLKRQFQPTTSTTTEAESTFAEFEAVASLRQPWELLKKLKLDRKDAQINKPVACANVAVNVNPVAHSQQDQVAMAALVKDVHTLITLRDPPDPVIRLSTPLYAEIGFFCTRADHHKVSLRCTFGLNLMLETFKTQLRQSRALSQRPNYRLKSLQLAQQAIKSLGSVLEDPTMPCRCPQTLALALQSVQEDLKKFTQKMVFDLFFQTPWVACTHMLEIMDVLFFYGIRLVTYRHYVGSVLHIYNALQTLTDMKSIPLLDILCENLSRVVFPGCHRPKRNFRSSYTRYMGGRLNVKLHKQRHKSGVSHDGGWHMTIPRDMARTASGLGMREAIDDPRFDCKKLSVFYYVKEKKYNLDDHVRDQCQRCHTNNTTTTSSSPTHPCDHNHPPTTPTTRLHTLKSAILKDFSGPLPLARTNFCAVYLACVHIISAISDQWHEDHDAGKRCLCFVDLLLADADARVLNEGSGKVVPARYRALWRICGDVLAEELGGEKGVEGFLFDVE